jgi:uncharacterized SAM-binding protein YcdF (DUF218 family)
MTDTLFFILSKLIWLAFSPDALIVLFLVLCLVLIWFNRLKKAKILLHIVVSLCLVITFLPVGQWVLYPLESRFLPVMELPRNVDGIIMLAGAENLSSTEFWKQHQLGDAAERYTQFIYLMNHYPDARHIFTGGIGSLNQSGINSSDVAKMFFASQSVDINEITFESESRNTYENVVNTRKRVRPLPGETWLMVTSAYHMPRAIGIFSKQNWPVIPFPVDYKTHPEKLLDISVNFSGNLSHLCLGLHEWTGLLAYYLTGKTAGLLPRSDGTALAVKGQ